MIGEPLEAWHNALAKMPVTVVSFEWDDKRGLPSKIVLDVERSKLSGTITQDLVRARPRYLRRGHRRAAPPARIALYNFGHGLGGRLFDVAVYDTRHNGFWRRLFSTGNLHNLTIAISSHVPT